MRSATTERLPIGEGTITGLAAWAFGYVVTYLIVAPDVRESPLHRLVRALEGEPATYEMVGWVFYNAHFVDTVFRNVPFVGGHTTTFVGGDGGFTALLYAVPAGALFAAGFAVGSRCEADNVIEGVLAAATVVPGYLLPSIAGAFLFEVALGGASGGPDPLAAVALAGAVYPAVFAVGGSTVEIALRNRDRRAVETNY
jgi:hypothetical protein